MNDSLMWLLGGVLSNTVKTSFLETNALKLGAIIGTMSISFFGMRLWVFFQKRTRETECNLADAEAVKRPAITYFYDIDTIIMGTLKPVSEFDTVVVRAIDQTRVKDFATHGPVGSIRR